MRVLVTGGAGYIGSITTRVLLDAGHEVVVLDSLERGHRAAVDSRATLVIASVSDAEVLDSVLPGIDGVLHCAGYIDVAESQSNTELYYRKNLAEPSMMLDRMTSNGVRHLVFSSTAAVYGQPDEMPITETSEKHPINAYGSSKLAFERMIELTESVGLLTAVRLRYFNVAGAHPDGTLGEAHPTETHIIPLLLEAARDDTASFVLFGEDYPTRDGTCVRDYIHVMDLAEAHRLALEHLHAGGASAICNLGSGRGYTNREVAETCREVTGGRIRVEHGARREGDPATLIASNERARELLGWSPSRDLHAMIADAWRWHAGHPKGYAS